MGVAETGFSGVVFCARVDRSRVAGSSWDLESVLSSRSELLWRAWSSSKEETA